MMIQRHKSAGRNLQGSERSRFSFHHFHSHIIGLSKSSGQDQRFTLPVAGVQMMGRIRFGPEKQAAIARHSGEIILRQDSREKAASPRNRKLSRKAGSQKVRRE